MLLLSNINDISKQKGGVSMKKKKLVLGSLSAILSLGLLFGCGTPQDEQEPDPTEEPSEENDEPDKNDKDNEMNEEQKDKQNQ
jgi:hypothetical protein